MALSAERSPNEAHKREIDCRRLSACRNRSGQSTSSRRQFGIVHGQRNISKRDCGQSRATLSGSFVVDLTTGFVVSTDLFHGATELNIIGNQGANDPTFPDVYLLQVTNSDGDLLA